MPELSLTTIARAYGVALIDAGKGVDGLIMSSGAGVMTATLDLIGYRYVFDIDACRNARLADFLLWAERLCSHIVVVGWFSLTDPLPLREAIEGLREPRRVIAYTPFTNLGATHVESMAELAHMVAVIARENARGKVDAIGAKTTGNREGRIDGARVLEDPGEAVILEGAAGSDVVRRRERATAHEVDNGDGMTGKFPIWGSTRANEQRAAVLGAPGPHLNGLDPVSNHSRPR